MYPKNSILRNIFDKQLLEMYEKGIFSRQFQTVPNDSPQSVVVPVNLEFVLVLFIILIVGTIMSLVTFVLEKYGFNQPEINHHWP